MTGLGEPALWLAFIFAAWGGVASIVAIATRRRDFALSGARATPIAFACLLVAAGALASAVWTHDFAIRYVAQNTSINLPVRFLFAAIWAGAGGSLLIMGLAIAGCATVAAWTVRRDAALFPWVTAVTSGVLAILLTSLALDVNPFAPLAVPVGEGQGLRGEFQVDSFLVHPPLMAFGIAATVVPFALSIGALATRTIDETWVRRVRTWGTVGWALLTSGILAGAHWAYARDGWGVWARDPVQGTWLLAWLAGAFVVHRNTSRAPTAEGTMLQLLLSLGTFILAAFALAVTRSGIVSSQHSFAFSPGGATLASIPMVALLGSAMLLARGRRSVIGAVRGPAVARISTTVLTIGIALLAAGLAGSAMRRTFPLSLGDGEIWRGRDPFGRLWSLASEGKSTYQRENFAATAVTLRSGAGGGAHDFLTAELRSYLDSEERVLSDRVSAPLLRAGALEDVKLVLVDDLGARPQLRLTFIPLGSWLWAGGALVVIAALLALLPGPKRSP